MGIVPRRWWYCWFLTFHYISWPVVAIFFWRALTLCIRDTNVTEQFCKINLSISIIPRPCARQSREGNEITFKQRGKHKASIQCRATQSLASSWNFSCHFISPFRVSVISFLLYKKYSLLYLVRFISLKP